MNKLSRGQRSQILHLLCEGNSIRAITRLTGASKTTVTKLVVDAGQAAAWYQDRVLHNLPCKRLQLDEIWGFVGAKAKNAKAAKKVTGEQGDVWVWVATDADTKLVASWRVGNHAAPAGSALAPVGNRGRQRGRTRVEVPQRHHGRILARGLYLRQTPSPSH